MTKLYQLLKKELPQENFRRLKRGDTLYHEGETPEFVALIETGIIGLFHVTELGHESFLRIFGPHYLLGHRSLLAEENFHASSVALKETTLQLIPKHDFLKILELNNPIQQEMFRILARDLGQAEERLGGLMDRSAPKRIIQTLIYLYHKDPEHAWTRKEIAEYSQSTTETVTRVMSKLEQENLLIKKKRLFELPTVEDLVELSDKFKL